MNKFLEETVFLSTMWKKPRKKDTDEVVIEFFEKEIKEKLSANDIDPINLEKNKMEVDLRLLSSNLPGSMFVM